MPTVNLGKIWDLKVRHMLFWSDKRCWEVILRCRWTLDVFSFSSSMQNSFLICLSWLAALGFQAYYFCELSSDIITDRQLLPGTVPSAPLCFPSSGWSDQQHQSPLTARCIDLPETNLLRTGWEPPILIHWSLYARTSERHCIWRLENGSLCEHLQAIQKPKANVLEEASPASTLTWH